MEDWEDRDFWKDGAAYAALLAADRPAFAWEWLRRDTGYRRAARAALRRGTAGGAAGARAWGLHAWERPDAPAPQARPLWCADHHPLVLRGDARAAGSASPDAIDFRAWPDLVTVHRDGRQQHLLLSDGLRSLRIDLDGVDIRAGPVEISYRLSGIVSAEPPLLTLRRLLALARSGRFARGLHPPERRAGRWILLLRAHDGLCAGAGQREIARVLLHPAAAAPAWRDRSPSLRLQAQRLVRSARRLGTGDWRQLLR